MGGIIAAKRREKTRKNTKGMVVDCLSDASVKCFGSLQGQTASTLQLNLIYQVLYL